MFAILYEFEVKPGSEENFRSLWKQLTSLIYEFEGSYGSRLHLAKDGKYIAYAQWPDRHTWENSGDNLPPHAENIRTQMKEACNSIRTVYELEMLDDLLQSFNSLVD